VEIRVEADLINMRDGRVSKAIAETSEQIARESKRDSSAMKTLAVLTTVFLPPTFVAVSLIAL
jgi:Mg2+ and Co2+ transporter CorA